MRENPSEEESVTQMKGNTMLAFAGKTYAKNDKEMVESLFTPGGTCAGFYKKRKNGFLLLNLQREPFAFVVCSPAQGYFVVTAFLYDGKVRFMYSTCSVTEEMLGIVGMGYTAIIEACRECRENSSKGNEMTHLKTNDKRFLCPMFRKGYSDYKRFGENGLADEMPVEYYRGVQAAAWEDVPDEYLEDHSHD